MVHILISCKLVTAVFFRSSGLCGNILTGDKQKWSNIMIQSNESIACTVINTKQINSCETDGLGSAIKCQNTEELLVDVFSLKCFLLRGQHNKTLLCVTLEFFFLIFLINKCNKTWSWQKKNKLSPFSHCDWVVYSFILVPLCVCHFYFLLFSLSLWLPVSPLSVFSLYLIHHLCDLSGFCSLLTCCFPHMYLMCFQLSPCLFTFFWQNVPNLMIN